MITLENANQVGVLTSINLIFLQARPHPLLFYNKKINIYENANFINIFNGNENQLSVDE